MVEHQGCLRDKTICAPRIGEDGLLCPCLRCSRVGATEIDRLRARVAELESAGRETVAALETYQQRLAEYGCESWIDAKGLIGRFRAAGLDTPATEGRPHRPLSPDHQAAIRESIERDLGSYAPEDDY